jgi:hypothetical protein
LVEQLIVVVHLSAVFQIYGTAPVLNIRDIGVSSIWEREDLKGPVQASRWLWKRSPETFLKNVSERSLQPLFGS